MSTTVEWKRKPKTYAIDGSSTSNSEVIMSAPMFANKGDEYLTMTTYDTINTSISTPYTYVWRRDFNTLDGNGNVVGSNVYEMEMHQTDTESSWRERINGGEWLEKPLGGPGTAGAFGWEFQLIAYDPGTYEVLASTTVNGIAQQVDFLLGKFDLRALQVIASVPTEPFDPQEVEVYPIVLTAEVTTLPPPGPGRVFPLGWIPEAPLTWTMNGSSQGASAAFLFDTGTVLNPSYTTNLSTNWDGKNENGDYARVPISLSWNVIDAVPASNPNSGNHYDEAFARLPIFHRKCECDETSGELQISVPLSSDGPVPLTANYLSFNGHFPSASLGWGWNSTGSAKLTLLGSGDLIYRSESGHVLRWEPSGATFVPVSKDNYVVAQSLGGGGHRLTFRNQSYRDFNSSGKVIADVDRNGNTISYTYNGSGHLASVSDGQGRYHYYDYGSRTDGQPEEIRINHPTTGRRVQFEYDAEDRLERVTNPAGEVTEFEYGEYGLLSKMTQVRPVLGDLVIEYSYLNRRLVSENIYGVLARNHSGYNIRSVGLHAGAELCGRTLDTLYDVNGNFIYREDNKPDYTNS